MQIPVLMAGGLGEHRVRCLYEQVQMCDGFSFETKGAGWEGIRYMMSLTAAAIEKTIQIEYPHSSG